MTIFCCVVCGIDIIQSSLMQFAFDTNLSCMATQQKNNTMPYMGATGNNIEVLHVPVELQQHYISTAKLLHHVKKMLPRKMGMPHALERK